MGSLEGSGDLMVGRVIGLWSADSYFYQNNLPRFKSSSSFIHGLGITLPEDIQRFPVLFKWVGEYLLEVFMVRTSNMGSRNMIIEN